MKRTLLFYICCLISGSIQAQDWKLRKASEDIRVYTRQLDSTSFNEYKAVMQANTSPERALRVICDGDRLWEWNHKTSDSEQVAVYNDSTFVIWMLNDLPWPLRDRENLSLIKVKATGDDEYMIDISPADNTIRKTPDDVIRTTRFKGHWSIRPLGNGKTEIIQQLYGDPNGSIPAWILNSVITNVPFHSFENLKVILEN